MNARILTVAALTFTYAGVLPAKAADPGLLNLMMPDAKVVAGVNVDQAKTSPFGQYVLTQIQATQSADLQKLVALTGFDPTRDVHEVLVGSNGDPKSHSGLVLARGAFDGNRIAALAATEGGKTETYKGVTILTDPKGEGGVAFLDSTLVAAGDIANVKAAIDRRSAPSVLPAAVIVQINQWSTSQDAWVVTTVPPSTLHPPATAPNMPGMNGAGAFAAVQSAAGGVKLGNNVVVTGSAVADTAQNAQSIGDTLKFLANLAQMQASNEPQVAALAQSLQVTNNGTTVTATVTVPEATLQDIVKPKAHARRPAERVRR